MRMPQRPVLREARREKTAVWLKDHLNASLGSGRLDELDFHKRLEVSLYLNSLAGLP